MSDDEQKITAEWLVQELSKCNNVDAVIAFINADKQRTENIEYILNSKWDVVRVDIPFTDNTELVCKWYNGSAQSLVCVITNPTDLNKAAVHTLDERTAELVSSALDRLAYYAEKAGTAW